MNLLTRFSWVCFVGLAGLSSAAFAASGDPLELHSRIGDLLYDHCGDCHMDGVAKGGASFDDLDSKSSILEKREMWRKMKEAVVFGDMPPDPEDTGFSQKEVDQIVAWIEEKIEMIDHADPIYQDPGPAIVRPLTPTEYNNTIRDLLGVEFNIEAECGLMEEPPVHGFTNTAAAMSMDPVILEKFFLAADKVLEKFAAPDHAAKRLEVFVAHPSRGDQPGPAAKTILFDLAARAYRREVSPQVVANLGPLFADGFKETNDFDAAITKALKPLLVSPMFLFRMEKPVPSEGRQETELSFQVLDEELAVRLSYFLWATMPDRPLRQKASQGILSNPQVLRSEVLRMMKDPKTSSLQSIFADQWLKLYKLNSALPSPDVYPSLTPELKDDMRRETLLFIEDVMRGDRSLLNLLDSNYTFLNERLAKHYGIRGVLGDEFRRVRLEPEHHRGGLLGMASFLTATSHTDRTKPTLRGTYILEVILGTPPTPPPAEASVFKKEAGKDVVIETFRDQLNFHASDPNCAACHKKIDPLGFALENFDPIGRWFDDFDGKPIDNVGQLPTGENIAGFRDLKKVISDRQDLFLQNVTKQAMSYALGRELSYYDMAAVEKIVERLKKNEYRFSELILGITETVQFQHRRKVNPQSH